MDMVDIEELFNDDGDSSPAPTRNQDSDDDHIQRYDDDRVQRYDDDRVQRYDDDDDDQENQNPSFTQPQPLNSQRPNLDLDPSNAESQGMDRQEEPSKEAPKEEGEKKKRIIREPQPKLDPDRICGQSRGIYALETIFENFQAKGHEFDDLDRVMKKMENWAHRLYPKLPFDDVMDRIAELGKKRVVQTHIKRIRMDLMPTGNSNHIDQDDEEEHMETGANDEIIRYEEEVGENPDPSEDEFERLMREAEERKRKEEEEELKPTKLITDEQRELMRRNREKALQRRKQFLSQDKEKDTSSTSSILNGNVVETLAEENIESDSKSAKTDSDDVKDAEINDDTMTIDEITALINEGQNEEDGME